MFFLADGPPVLAMKRFWLELDSFVTCLCFVYVVLHMYVRVRNSCSGSASVLLWS